MPLPDAALTEHWLLTAAEEACGPGRGGDQGADEAFRDIGDGEHAHMVAAARQLLDRRRKDGTSPDRIRDLEYGYQLRRVESYPRMLANPVFARGFEDRLQVAAADARARLDEMERDRADP